MRRTLLGVLATSLVLACSSGGGGGGAGGDCPDWSGNYELEGTCAAGATCNATQSGCYLSVQCSDGTNVSGTLTQTGFNLSGTSAGASVTCSGGYDGDNLKGQCQFSGGSCELDVDCKSGPCDSN